MAKRWFVRGAVFLSASVDYEIEANTEEKARKFATEKAYAESWPEAEVQEVCIDDVQAIESTWTSEDNIAAKREGWAVFNYGDGDARIEHLDSPEDWQEDLDLPPPQLNDDLCAWRLVCDGMFAGSDLHTRAFNAVSHEERKIICKTLVRLGGVRFRK